MNAIGARVGVKKVTRMLAHRGCLPALCSSLISDVSSSTEALIENGRVGRAHRS